MLGGKKKSADKPKRDHSGKNLAQYGLFDTMNFGSSTSVDSGGDSDLEAELAALAGGADLKPKRPARNPVPDHDLDAMVAESMRDIPSDAELSGDDDDPDLLNELTEIAGGEVEAAPADSSNQSVVTDVTKILDARLSMYEDAEKKAKAAGETSRARRFNRGVKTLKDLIKQAKSGKIIDNEEIPPEVTTVIRKPITSNDDNVDPEPVTSRPIDNDDVDLVPTRSAPAPPEIVQETTPAVEVNTDLVNMLIAKQKQFKVAALRAKKAGDAPTAISYIKIAKQFDVVIVAAQNGQPVDLSLMPNPPPDPATKPEENQVQQHETTSPTTVNDERNQEDDLPAADTLITASSVAEALEQRLDVYQKQVAAATEQGNSSKARRMGRIVKQYEQAIKAHQAGKTVAFEELPTPPGYAGIPGVAPPPPPPSNLPGATADLSDKSVPTSPPPPPKSVPSTSQTTRISGNQMPNSRAEQQMVVLLAKQKEFKLAALNAKRKGEMEQAKEYLRSAKGFEPLIEAASCGLPVDLSTIPISPTAKTQLDDEYDLVMSEECTDDNTGDVDVITRLEAQLNKQLKMCLSTRDHHKALGDVAGTNRFERLALNVTKDLDIVRLAHRTPGAGVPKFHYETKDFSIVKSFTELGDNDLELTIMRGINYTCANPKEIDTYVKFDFPFPQDVPYSDRTSVVKDTNSPDYNTTFTIPIQRTARACQRVFKRHSIKFEIYSKGGFFRGDTLIGTVNVKLQHLETQCELHESFDLLDGRKKVGGKLEVRLRLRHPIVSQQMEQLHEKWLIIDN